MIKQLITTVLLATGINNTLVNNSSKDNKNFVSYPATIQNVIYDNNNNLNYAEYYQVKEIESPLNLQYATAIIKGYTYLYVNVPQDIVTCYTDYYAQIEYNDPDFNEFTFNELQINLRGYLNTNTALQPYYEDYYLYGNTTTYENINSFIYADTYNQTMLRTARDTSIPTLNTTNTVDTVGTNTTITVESKYQTLKFRLVWQFDEIRETGEINTNLIPNILSALTPVYSSTTTTYYWSVNIEYTQEIIDIPGLLFTMLGMPFAWISTAFDLTLFPGTMYELHVASLFMALIGILILVFVIRKLLK